MIMGAAGLGSISNIVGTSEVDKKWFDYNYPPKLRLIHYSLDGL